MKNVLNFSLVALLVGAFVLVGCKKDEEEDLAPPEAENEVEEFTYIEFIFTNENDPEDVTKGIWEDEDGFGPLEPVILQHPTFRANTTYRLTFVFENRLLTPVYNLWEEIKDEDDEHQVFFAFDEGLFTNPEGIGNISDNTNPINYQDFDENGLPVGLETLWTVADVQEGALFRAVLGHQPGVKGPNSTWDSGDIDWDITFIIHVTE